MTQFKIDSWNSVQLSRLRDFFRDQAKEGDTVIFDRKLAEVNAPVYEGLNDQDCNSWVYRVANQALIGMSDEKIQTLAKTVTLTTAYLHSQYPEDERHGKPPVNEEPAASEWDDDGIELDLEVLERPQTKPAADVQTDQEAAEWAKIVAQHKNKPKIPA